MNRDSTWIVVDVSSLAYRAFHSMRDLTFEGLPTAVCYGMLRDILYLRDLFSTDNFVFTFDRGKSKRVEIYPEYKGQRRDEIVKDEQQVALRKSVRVQIKRMHDTILPELGYKNIVSATGFESDDLIAAICDRYVWQPFVLVSSDHDLWQLLSEQHLIWSPAKKKAVTAKSFRQEWGLIPQQWADVLALAGCTTDNVKGLRGVGPKTAAKYLRGELTKGRIFELIQSSTQLWQSNLELVKLPFRDTPCWTIKQDDVTAKKWGQVCRTLGINSLRY